MAPTNDATYQPAGYCPKCGYAMDPGQCPECGREVSPRALLSIHPTKRFWRRVRWGGSIVIIAAIGLVGYRYYHVAPWESWLPNRLLIAMADMDSDRVRKEIAHRATNGKLDEETIKSLITDGIAWSPKYAAQVPARTKLPFSLQNIFTNDLIYHIGHATRLNHYGHDWQFRIIGNNKDPIALPTYRTTHQSLAFTYFVQPDGPVYSILPKLEPGEYMLECSGETTFSALIGTTRLEFSEPIRFELPLSVSERPISDFVNPIYDATRFTTRQPRFSASKGKHFRHKNIIEVNLSCFQPSEHCAFLVYTRLDGENSYSINQKGKIPLMISCRVNDPFSVAFVHINLEPGAPPPQYLDLALVASPEVALAEGFQRYFSGVIEWTGLEVIDSSVLLSREPSFVPTQIHPTVDRTLFPVVEFGD